MTEAPGSARTAALAWARRWARRSAAPDHELLEVPAGASLEEVRAAYHKLARLAHPDLHRAAATAEELEELTLAFARVSNAYSLMTGRSRRAGPAASGSGAIGGTPSNAISGTPSGPSSGSPSGMINNGPATGLSTKAKMHYRRAELCLRRGELVEARLHLRLALASDPQSTFLRKALEEIDRG